jgi:P4 family phage/plasmid primase-like protien
METAIMNKADSGMILGHESVVLSALMNGQNSLPVCADDFTSPPNRVIFNRISGLANRGLLAITDALRAAGELDKVGGAGRITEIATFPHDQDNLKYALDQMLEHSAARQAAKIGEQLHKGEITSDEAQEKLARLTKPKAETRQPANWFKEKFPGLAEEYGDPILEEEDNNHVVSVRDIGEDFFAASLGEKGSPDAPTIYLPVEERFYSYVPDSGIYQQRYEPMLLTQLSNLLLECARQCPPGCNTESLEFRFRDAASLSGVLRKARGILAVPPDFFATDVRFVPCANGMLRLKDNELLPFSPNYRRRNKLGVAYDPEASCPIFLDTLMRPALDAVDLDLLQRWCGLALIGANLAQKILLLTGTAGGGKGTFIQVINGVIGQINLATLRPQLLGERFELGRFLGKTLLYGADVPENFLNQRGASVLKSLTGGDPVTLEFKNSNESPAIICRFNVIVTCNSRLTVHLEGDTEAWRRRLVIIPYTKPKPERVIVNLAQRILKTESSGVLNWMLEGLDKLRADGWQLHLTAAQQASVDNVLLESDGLTLFVGEALQLAEDSELIVTDSFSAYVEFCSQRGWRALTRKQFGNDVGDAVTRQYGLTVRHDLKPGGGKAQRGWVGLGIKPLSRPSQNGYQSNEQKQNQK